MIEAARAALDKYGNGLSSVRFICGTLVRCEVPGSLVADCVQNADFFVLLHRIFTKNWKRRLLVFMDVKMPSCMQAVSTQMLDFLKQFSLQMMLCSVMSSTTLV